MESFGTIAELSKNATKSAETPIKEVLHSCGASARINKSFKNN